MSRRHRDRANTRWLQVRRGMPVRNGAGRFVRVLLCAVCAVAAVLFAGCVLIGGQETNARKTRIRTTVGERRENPAYRRKGIGCRQLWQANNPMVMETTTMETKRSCKNCEWRNDNHICTCPHCEDSGLPVYPFELCPAWQYREATDGE